MSIKLNPIFRLIFKRFFFSKWEKKSFGEPRKEYVIAYLYKAIQRKSMTKKKLKKNRVQSERKRKKNHMMRLWDKLKRCHFTPYFFVATILFLYLFETFFRTHSVDVILSPAFLHPSVLRPEKNQSVYGVCVPRILGVHFIIRLLFFHIKFVWILNGGHNNMVGCILQSVSLDWILQLFRWMSERQRKRENKKWDKQCVCEWDYFSSVPFLLLPIITKILVLFICQPYPFY